MNPGGVNPAPTGASEDARAPGAVLEFTKRGRGASHAPADRRHGLIAEWR